MAIETQKQLTVGKLFAMVDGIDYHKVSGYRWYPLKSQDRIYATTVKDGKTVYLHQLILPCKPPFEIDHCDRNGLNCTRKNLRRATRSQNSGNQRIARNNTSGFKGVYWHKGASKWMAYIDSLGKRYYLGLHSSKLKAAAEYDKAARRFFGEFARLNLGAP